MKTTPVLLVGLDDVEQAIATKAVRSAFPGASTTVVASIDEALRAGAPGGAELLILGAGSEDEAAKAGILLDEQSLPRWAVTVLEERLQAEVEYVVLPRTANTETMAGILINALRLYRARRENARLRGDLQTVASRVNHDLRTPLSPIYTSCEVLRLTLGPSAPAHAPVLQSISNAVDELTLLIDRVSFVLKASAMPRPKAQVAMGELVFGALARLESRSMAVKALITQPKMWPEVSGVAPWLETMWVQLLANGLQHAGPAPRLELGWEEGEHEFRFWVRNEGKEIPPEKRAKFFQPFNQLHQTNASRGLGLSMVRRLADLQCGRCGYEALGPDASRFFFTLPR